MWYKPWNPSAAVFVVLSNIMPSRKRTFDAAVREQARVTVIVTTAPPRRTLFQRGSPALFLARLLLVVLRSTTLASEHFLAADCAPSTPSASSFWTGAVLRGIAEGPPLGRTRAEGRRRPRTGRPSRPRRAGVVPRHRGVPRPRQRGTSLPLRPAVPNGAYGARAERRGCPIPVMAVEMCSYPRRSRRRGSKCRGASGSFANRAAVREKVNGTMCAAFSDRSRYHLIDKAVSKSQKSTFSTNGEKKNGLLVQPRGRHEKSFPRNRRP